MIMIENECSRLDILLHCAIGCHWLPLVLCIYGIPLCSPIIGNILHQKKLEIPKGRTILSWGRLYNIKPKLHTIDIPKTYPCCIPQYKQWSILMSYTFVPYITPINISTIYMFSNHTQQYICIMQLNIQSLSTIGFYN